MSEPVVFISHRSIDKGIADMLLDFFICTGIPREYFFCSSLPGNDIDEKISAEIRAKIRDSSVNVVILSCDFYQSAYCLSEAGIMWFRDTIPVIPIALPEITSDNMYGFLNNEYKIRRLSCDDDISYIYDTVRTAVSVNQCKASITTAETSKLKARFIGYIEKRPTFSVPAVIDDDIEVLSDDEAVVLYFIISKKVRKIRTSSILAWMTKEELYEVNVDNAFDLLSSIGNSKFEDDVLILDINLFRRCLRECEDLIPRLLVCVEKHRKLSRETFEIMWKSGLIDDAGKLFISYIVDEQIITFGDRWMAEAQIEAIKQWETRFKLDSTLSTNYCSCLSLFIKNLLVYDTGWTSYGNPRAYSLCESLKNYLFSPDFQYIKDLDVVKSYFSEELPF